MSRIVFDASAVLAIAKGEKGADAALAKRAGAIISAVNHAEVVSKLLRIDVPLEEIDHFLADAFPGVIPFDRQQADIAAQLHAKTRKNKLSYADCACLALAMLHAIPVLTADSKWSEIKTEVEVRQLR